jgi:glycosyltransferase involved in cell wall biosynthesis
MRILTIASMIPVPGLIQENKYVINHILNHCATYSGDEFRIFRPSPFLPEFISVLSSKRKLWENRRNVVKDKSYKIDDLKIEILPYISIGSIAVLHSLLSRSVYYFNIKLIKSLSQNKPDIIHAHNIFPDGFLAYKIKKKFKIPYTLNVQDERRFFINNSSLKLAKLILDNASAITTLSSLMKESLDVQKPGYVKLVALGIHESFNIIKKRFDDSSKIKFVTAANLIPVKNLVSVVQAMSLLKDNAEITYTIIGDGPEKEKLVKLSDSLGLKGKISFLPQIQNNLLAEELVKYDVYIQPSYKETYGLSYFEALACGLPVILTNNTGAYHFIRDIDCYLLVDPSNVEDIKNKILIAARRNWINDRIQNCAEASLIAKWDTFISRMNHIYMDCIERE